MKIWMKCISLLLLLTMVSACTQNTTEDHENTSEGSIVESFEHIHGLSYGLHSPHDLYLSTHHGLIRVDTSSEWRWVGKHQHDLMGFTVQNEKRMIASGHPEPGSTLQNPLGIVISEDYGATWEPIALHGEIDFHYLDVNAGDSSIVYAINDHGPLAGFYQSIDGGYQWERKEAVGFPSDFASIYALVSDPGNPEAVLLGTGMGMLISTDGGTNWEVYSTERTFTTAKGMLNKSGHLVAYIIGKEDEGVARSDDFGQTWTFLNLSFEDDAGMHIAIHPTMEGRIAIATHREKLFETTDGGENWVLLADSREPLK